MMKRGTRVQMKFGNPRHVGTIESVIHRRHGSFAAIRWDNGWHSTFGFGELELAEPEAHATECDVMHNALKGGERN